MILRMIGKRGRTEESREALIVVFAVVKAKDSDLSSIICLIQKRDYV